MTFKPVIFAALLLGTAHYTSANDNLPILGDSTSSIISLDKEYKIGQAWARSLRGNAPLLNDPITYSYLYDLVWQLAAYSQLQDRRLDLVILDNPTLNAFAVPGGVVGIHGGLLLSAEQEDELASVITHEFAHLSQRHFASQLEQARRNRPLSLATILGSILILAADSSAGTAALTTSIAAQQASRLAFSRQNEQEADRIGMQNLVEAGIDPNAMPRMFARMQRSLRFEGAKPPEFLLTHPVTESRIADSLNRAAQLPTPPKRRNALDFTIIRIRMAVHFTKNPQDSFNYYQNASNNNADAKNLYGLALAAIRLNKFSAAQSALEKLPTDWKNHRFVRLTLVENTLSNEQWQNAIGELTHLNSLYPGDFAVDKLLAKAFMGAKQPEKATKVLEQLIEDHPNDVDAWYLLSEALGQAGKRLAVHEARTEYFLLTGQVDRALQQILFANREPNLSESDRARLSQLESDAKRIREEMKMDL